MSVAERVKQIERGTYVDPEVYSASHSVSTGAGEKRLEWVRTGEGPRMVEREVQVDNIPSVRDIQSKLKSIFPRANITLERLDKRMDRNERERLFVNLGSIKEFLDFDFSHPYWEGAGPIVVSIRATRKDIIIGPMGHPAGEKIHYEDATLTTENVSAFVKKIASVPNLEIVGLESINNHHVGLWTAQESRGLQVPTNIKGLVLHNLSGASAKILSDNPCFSLVVEKMERASLQMSGDMNMLWLDKIEDKSNVNYRKGTVKLIAVRKMLFTEDQRSDLWIEGKVDQVAVYQSRGRIFLRNCLGSELIVHSDFFKKTESDDTLPPAFVSGEQALIIDCRLAKFTFEGFESINDRPVIKEKTVCFKKDALPEVVSIPVWEEATTGSFLAAYCLQPLTIKCAFAFDYDESEHRSMIEHRAYKTKEAARRDKMSFFEEIQGKYSEGNGSSFY